MDPDHEFESDDSFFDDPKISKKTKTAEKKSLEDIFGFTEEKKEGKSGHSSLENIQSTSTKSKVSTLVCHCPKLSLLNLRFALMLLQLRRTQNAKLQTGWEVQKT